MNKNQAPVEITLKNFSHTSTHTIYIDVVSPAAIINLVRSLKKQLGLAGSQSFFPMKPHLTIARGLRVEQFKEAISDFQKREFNATFIADSMVLMKRESSGDNYTIIKEFEFRQ